MGGVYSTIHRNSMIAVSRGLTYVLVFFSILLDGMRRYVTLVKHTYSPHNHNRSSLLASTPRNKTTSCDQTLRCRSSTAPNSVYKKKLYNSAPAQIQPFPCAPIGAALPEVVRGHDHGASIDMQRVTPVVALRLRHLNGSRACLKQSSVGAYQGPTAFIKYHRLVVAGLPVSQVGRRDVLALDGQSPIGTKPPSGSLCLAKPLGPS